MWSVLIIKPVNHLIIFIILFILRIPHIYTIIILNHMSARLVGTMTIRYKVMYLFISMFVLVVHIYFFAMHLVFFLFFFFSILRFFQNYLNQIYFFEALTYPNPNFLIYFIFFLNSVTASKVLVLAFWLLMELNLLGIYFYQSLLQVFILLLFSWVRTIAGKISLYNIYFTIFQSNKNSSR